VVDRRVWGDGVRWALTSLTVAPIRAPVTVDRRAVGLAMILAPVVGGVLGLAGGAVGVGVVAAGGSTAVGAVLVVAAVAVLTRGLHLDGLADTADGLGSYADAPTALAIMRRPDIGPFGVAAVVLVLLAQTAAAAALLSRPAPAALAGIALATASGRLAITLGCRRGGRAARPDGLGALVAATVAPLALAAAVAGVAAAGVPAVPGRPWQGPVAVAMALLVAFAVLRHANRRLGGVTGDVLGAAGELAATVSYVILSI
jgi:adenosylcobinamide-GDP ribazoletransferase